MKNLSNNYVSQNKSIQKLIAQSYRTYIMSENFGLTVRDQEYFNNTTMQARTNVYCHFEILSDKANVRLKMKF